MRVLAAAVTVFVLVAPDASAATAEFMSVNCDKYGCETWLQYTAAPGEANDVMVSQTGSTVTIHDGGADIAPGSGCAGRSPHEVACDESCYGCLSTYVSIRLDLDDGDDRASGTVGFDAKGGPGDDRLFSQAGTLGGGGGRDVLVGGDGANVLADGDGVGGAPVDRDVIDGGGGTDVVSYAGRRTPVEFTVGTGSAGHGGSEDEVTDVEGATGGEADDHLQGELLNGSGGNDVLIGTAGGDSISGGAGDDVLVGGPGDDRLDPGTGADRVDGGAGDDEEWQGFDAPDPQPDRYRCGPGYDHVGVAGTRLDYVAPDCENVWPENVLSHSLRMLLPLRALGGPVAQHEQDCTPGPCPWSLSLRATRSRILLGRSSMRRTRKRFPRMILRLSRTGQAQLARRKRIEVAITACERRTCGRFETTLTAP
ncbi:MAG: calcium-binding protein [Thermoleophilaceae bacterium]